MSMTFSQLLLLRGRGFWDRSCSDVIVMTLARYLQKSPKARIAFHVEVRLIRMYRAEKKYLQILLSYSQAGPGRKFKQEQEEISRNHITRLFLGSVGPSPR